MSSVIFCFKLTSHSCFMDRTVVQSSCFFLWRGGIGITLFMSPFHFCLTLTLCTPTLLSLSFPLPKFFFSLNKLKMGILVWIAIALFLLFWNTKICECGIFVCDYVGCVKISGCPVTTSLTWPYRSVKTFHWLIGGRFCTAGSVDQYQCQTHNQSDHWCAQCGH